MSGNLEHKKLWRYSLNIYREVEQSSSGRRGVINDHTWRYLETIAQARITEDRYFINLAKEKVSHYMMLAAKLAGFPIEASAKSGASWLEAH